MTTVKTWPGKPYPLGATWTGDGVNFAIFSEHATGVELCLFDNVDAPEEIEKIPLRERRYSARQYCSNQDKSHFFLPMIPSNQAS